MDQICHAFTLHTLTVFYIKTFNLATVMFELSYCILSSKL